MTSTMNPGTVLGGRYRLEDLLEDIDGARFWKATDTVLARHVAVHVVDESDPRADALLEAARVSATVTDPHLLRVLDADLRDGTAWVINEWGAGQSLDVMVSRHVLPPDRAAWLVREVANAVSAAHAKGVAHGHLSPENVMVTESGTVRLIGFALDARLRARNRTGNYPDVDDLQADVLDLAGLLYTGLVGHWPGASTSQVRPAPRDGHGPLRPRQVRAGVPRPLDAICDRVLGRHPGERSAHQLAAVLTEYIGELVVADPALLASMLPETDGTRPGAQSERQSEPQSEPQSAPEPLAPPAAPVPVDDREPTAVIGEPGPQPEPQPEPQSEPQSEPEPEHRAPPEELSWEDEPWEEDAEQTGGAHAAVPQEEEHEPDLDATQDAVPVFTGRVERVETDAGEDTAWHQPSGVTAPPPPDLDPLPERPLFAPEGTRRTPKPGHDATGPSWGALATETDPSDRYDDTGTGGIPATETSGPIWPFGEDPESPPDDWEERTSKPWLRLPLIITVLAVVAVVVAVVLSLNGKGPIPVGGGSDPTPSASAQPGNQRVKIAGVSDFDPFGDPPEENPDETGRAVDGDPATAWQTLTYRGRPNLGGLKPGVGLVVDLGSIKRVGSVGLTLQGSPTDVSLYAAPTESEVPKELDGLREVAQRERAGTQTRLTLRSPLRTRYLVVWLTSLPPSGGGYRGGIAEIAVRS